MISLILELAFIGAMAFVIYAQMNGVHRNIMGALDSLPDRKLFSSCIRLACGSMAGALFATALLAALA